MTSVLLAFCGSAFADDEQSIVVAEPRTKVTSAIVTRLDTLPEARTNWLRANISTAKKHGFKFSRSYRPTNRDRDLVFSIQGPIIEKKTAGLTFRIRF